MKKQVKCSICGFVDDVGRSVCRRCGTPVDTSSGDSDSDVKEQEKQPQDELRFRKGQVIAKRYVIQGIVGQGGMGRIFRVHDNTLDEDVALKMLLPQYAQDKLVLERFFNEARIARGLSHPNIVRVHDIGTESNIVYISMELLPGHSLRAMLESLPAGQRLPIKKILHIFDGLCAALEYAHRYTIHRDIKPENVMVLPDDTVKLMDFGISKLMANPSLTSASMVMGTPYYMSPEQLKNSANVDARSDIYSVGVMLYEVLTGQAPTGIKKPASFVSSEVPPALDPIVEKCLEADPDKRYRDASELRAALANLAAPQESTGFERLSAPVQARPVETVSSITWKKAGGAVLLALLAIVFAGSIRQAERHRAEVSAGGGVLNEAQRLELEFDRQQQESSYKIMAGLHRTARLRARAVVQDIRFRDPEQAALKQAYLVESDQSWTTAKDFEESNLRLAMDAGWQALYRLLAIIVWPEGMVFIPPGEVPVRKDVGSLDRVTVGAFFIDQELVSVTAFQEFCRKAPWPQVYADSMETPVVTEIAYYDALAYASSQDLPKRVPTEAQLRRAVNDMQARGWLVRMGIEPDYPQLNLEETVEDGEETPEAPLIAFYMNDSIWEWTRSPIESAEESDAPDSITFGSRLVALNGGWDESDVFIFASRKSEVFENRTDLLGFRCVYEFPDTLEAIAALLK
ncbi:MAG: protein kinase [Candidatus Hydrogenedentes bacterium]|nr:protein kinase [Candidatus Hydrogenedentota bacterium]